MIIVSQHGQAFNFDTAHSVNHIAESSDSYVIKINYWIPRENPHLPEQRYLIPFRLGTFRTEETAEKIYTELIEAFENGSRVYRVPKE